MERSKYLETLSFEHHDGLVIALRIKKDLKNEVKPAHLFAYVIDVYENGLQHHFHQEEVCFNKVMQNIAAAEKLMNRMETEHMQFAELVKEIQAPGSNVLEQIRIFGELLNDHIRFEERELFPVIEQSLSSEQLEAISIYLHREHRPLNKQCHI